MTASKPRLNDEDKAHDWRTLESLKRNFFVNNKSYSLKLASK